MNSDFRVAVDFFSHHKARKLKKRLSSDGLISLLQLWAYAAKLRTDGELSGMDEEDIEIAACWDGEDGAFVAALVEVGFLDQRGDAYALHDWVENNSWAADAADRQDKARFSRLATVNRAAFDKLNRALENALTSQRQNFAARDALGTVATQDKPGNWQLIKAQRQFPAIPEQAGLTPDEMSRFGAIQQDTKRGLDTVNMAGVNGSPTAQLQRVLQDLGQFRRGTMGGGGMARNMLNDVIAGLTGHADDKIENMLIQGVLDPEYALKLMSNTNNMPGNGLLDSARRWTGSGGGESYADMLKRYGVATTVGAGRTPAQAEQKRK